eukprot:gb/GFBE01004168.1/.p1 GENE.gb/GFBE01004168.1/~~gb/GFBE01004168.1/.p1  ORF type:complete len:302 (+),score=38.51 gb/GFBE01004168.1/:1-906(+)
MLGWSAAIAMRLLCFISLLQTVVVEGANDQDVSVPESEWFLADQHEAVLEAYLDSWQGAQVYAMVDMFGASSKMAKCWRRQGWHAAAFDIQLSADHDIVTLSGCLLLCDLLMMLIDGGLTFSGPPCSVFGGMCLAIHKRHILGPLGDTTQFVVRLANAIATNAATVVRLARKRRRFFVVFEQPRGSYMYTLGAFVALTHLVAVLTYMGLFEHQMEKPTRLLGDLPGLDRLARAMTKQNREKFRKSRAKRNARRGIQPPVVVKTSLKSDGSKAFTGTSKLQESAEYTAAFCRAVYKIWLSSR